MADPVTGNLFDPLPAPLKSSDQRPIIRGTKTYRAPIVVDDRSHTPILCAVANGGNRMRCATCDDPTDRWTLGLMPTSDSDAVQAWGSLIWVDDLKMFVASSLNGASAANDIVTSKNGLDWWGGLVNPQSQTFNFQQLAYAPSLGMLCAVSVAGPTTSTRVATSIDGGKNWVPRTLPNTNISLLGVAWSPTLSLFAALATSNGVYTSPDGVTWTSRTGPTTSKNWKLGCWAGGTINKFCFASFDGGTAAACYSSNGTTWTNGVVSSSGLSTPDSIAYSPDLDQVIVVDGNAAALALSTDGINYTKQTSNLGTSKLHGVTWSHDLGLWIITSENGYLYTSPNGTTWTERQPPSRMIWNRVAASR